MIAAQNALAAARPTWKSGRRRPRPGSRPCTRPSPRPSGPQILAAAEAVLAVVPEHPAARQARARAWQQIAAIGPSGAAQWPQRGARTAQAAALMGLAPSPKARPARDPPPPIGRAAARTRGDLPAAGAAGIAGLTASSAGRDRPQRQPGRGAAGRPVPARPLARAEADGPKGRFLLWVDAVGGYLVCLDDRIVLGRAGPDSHADVPLMGDLSRNHATLVRDGEGYVLQAHHSLVRQRQAGRPSRPSLRDGDVIRLGSTVELEFRQPSPVSATARLAIVSRHRLPLAVDGVLLMAETCIVGGSGQAHIPAPALREPVVLYRQGDALWCRATGGFEVDGRTCAARAALTLQSSVLGDGFSFSLEPLGTPVRSNRSRIGPSGSRPKNRGRRDELTCGKRPRSGTRREHQPDAQATGSADRSRRDADAADGEFDEVDERDGQENCLTPSMDETVVYQANDLGFRARSAHGKFRHAQRHAHAPGPRPLHLRLGRPPARRLHDQAGHRPGRVRRGLLRHVRLRQGSRAEADPPQPRRRAPRGRAVHEPEVPEPADDLRPEEQRRGRQRSSSWSTSPARAWPTC